MVTQKDSDNNVLKWNWMKLAGVTDTVNASKNVDDNFLKDGVKFR